MELILLCISTVISFPLGQPFAQEPNHSPWRFESQRPEISPRSWRDTSVQYEGRPTLALAGGGKAYADGRWVKTVAIEPEAYYRFRAHFRCRDVEEPGRSVLARVLWQNAQGKEIGPAEYPATLRGESPGGWRCIEQIYRSPAGAAQARLELVYRWDSDGTVNFEEAALEKVSSPEPRLVRLSTVRYRPPRSSTARENLERFARLIEQAAAQRADAVCLPEAITLVGTGRTYVEAAEQVPGPTTEFLGNLARANSLYIVAGILERDGAEVHNTAVLLDRDGKLAGTYRKVCLPREESDGGVSPGGEFRTFDTDFGRIGIMICWDVAFPEPARELALDGAEVIFMPIWGGNTTLARARAIENQVYLVSSSYDMETGIFGLEGELMAEATDAQPVVVVEVDLGKKKDWPWLGDFKNRIPRELPPRKALRSRSGR